MGAPDIPEGEQVLMQGAFDPATYRREAIASAVAGLAFLAIAYFLLRPRAELAVSALLGAGAVFAVGYLQFRANRDRHWVLTARALYLSNRAPVPMADIRFVSGSASNLKLRVRRQRPLKLLGVPDAIALRDQIRKLMREARQ